MSGEAVSRNTILKALIYDTEQQERSETTSIFSPLISNNRKPPSPLMLQTLSKIDICHADNRHPRPTPSKAHHIITSILPFPVQAPTPPLAIPSEPQTTLSSSHPSHPSYTAPSTSPYPDLHSDHSPPHPSSYSASPLDKHTYTQCHYISSNHHSLSGIDSGARPADPSIHLVPCSRRMDRRVFARRSRDVRRWRMLVLGDVNCRIMAGNVP